MKLQLALAACSLLATSLSAQTIAHFDFDSSNLITPQPSFATVSDLQISNTYVFGGPSSNRWLCLTTAWNNTGGTLSFTVTPNPASPIDYGVLSWDAVTNNASISDSVRAATVKANGVPLAVIDPLTHLTTESVDLSTFPALQGAIIPVTFEIEFVGNPNGQSSYEVGQLRLTGGLCTPNCCIGNASVHSVGTGCAPSTATVPSLVSLSPPVLGQTLSVGVDSPSSPNSFALLCFGINSTFNPVFNLPLPIDLGLFGFPGCTLYCSSSFLSGLVLDQNGRAPFSVDIPVLPKWCEREITFQAFTLTPSNELMATQGLCNVVGN